MEKKKTFSKESYGSKIITFENFFNKANFTEKLKFSNTSNKTAELVIEFSIKSPINKNPMTKVELWDIVREYP